MQTRLGDLVSHCGRKTRAARSLSMRPNTVALLSRTRVRVRERRASCLSAVDVVVVAVVVAFLVVCSVRIRCQIGRHQPNLADSGPTLSRSLRKSVPNPSSLAKLGRCQARIAEVVRCLPRFCQNRGELDPSLGEVVPNSAEFNPSPANIGLDATTVRRHGPDLGTLRPTIPEFARASFRNDDLPCFIKFEPLMSPSLSLSLAPARLPLHSCECFASVRFELVFMQPRISIKTHSLIAEVVGSSLVLGMFGFFCPSRADYPVVLFMCCKPHGVCHVCHVCPVVSELRMVGRRPVLPLLRFKPFLLQRGGESPLREEAGAGTTSGRIQGRRRSALGSLPGAPLAND